MKPKFLSCAPARLIKSLEARREIATILNRDTQAKSVNYMLEHSTNVESCSEEQKQELSSRYHDIFLLFPINDQIQTLEKLLTEMGAKKIWKSLGKRIKTDYEYEHFWMACVDAKAGGIKVYKRTKAEHKKHFLRINKIATELSRLLLETNELIYYPVSNLISEDRIKQLRSNLKTDKSEQHIRSYLNETIPDIRAILNNIAVEAEKISETTPLVKKPNSKNSDTTKNSAIPYFTRSLSRYLKDKYNHPLHEVVAATARIVFDDTTIEADYVGKLLRS